jgi:hypothetical protein
VQVQEVSGDLAHMLGALLPLTSVVRRRFLFVTCDQGWTAYFDNGWQGTDAAALAHVARELRCRAVRAVAIPENTPRHAASVFEIYGPTATDFLNYVRSVSATNDGARWQFSQAGSVQPFEDLGAYESRAVRARFPLELLDRYLRAIGIRAFDEHFYRDSAFLVTVVGPMPAAIREYSLSEARKRLGLSEV